MKIDRLVRLLLSSMSSNPSSRSNLEEEEKKRDNIPFIIYRRTSKNKDSFNIKLDNIEKKRKL